MKRDFKDSENRLNKLEKDFKDIANHIDNMNLNDLFELMYRNNDKDAVFNYVKEIFKELGHKEKTYYELLQLSLDFMYIATFKLQFYEYDENQTTKKEN